MINSALLEVIVLIDPCIEPLNINNKHLWLFLNLHNIIIMTDVTDATRIMIKTAQRCR